MKQLALDIIEPPAPTFDNFVMGRNAEALAHVRAAAAGRGERFVYLWGGAGSGRTHLLKAAAANATYVRCEANSVFDDDVSLLAADDVERLGADAQVALFNRYNALREQGGGLIASGSVPPAQLKLRADLVTRLGWGLVVQLHTLTDDEKGEALAQQAHARGVKLAPDVIAYFLSHTTRNMGALFATLDALDRYSLQTKRAITVPLARDWLKIKK
ncbi:MAG: DnaA regulatory inactivator Hda [Betaproteobacteria bacterium]|nr:DnaA regulatory inactivator Hda [Betaproteobacteria bacterium]